METIASGHHAALDEQAIQLRAEIERGAVLEERQRFLRDMHDGLGGQLLTLLLRLRKAEGGTAVLAEDVQAIIGDLRLMTSALDDDGVSLVSALGRLRERIGAQCTAAGIMLDWEMDLPPETEGSVGDILNILRIVEEAATNSVRHSGANALSVKFTFSDMLEIRVSDDGNGFERDRIVAGNGLRSIEHRVAKLGGALSMESAPGAGSRLYASIPLSGISRSGPASQAGALREPPHSSI